MRKSESGLFIRKFSHIYVEKEALGYPLTRTLIEKFPQASVVEIDRYRELFARPRQRFVLQKQSPKWIVAVKKPPFVYPGAEVCHDFGHEHFYYASNVLNCLYDCEYCFLQGMFPSANLVLFVNVDDYFEDLERLLRRHPVYLSVSYESDLLALESVVPVASRWIEFARGREGLTVEIRTKSANYPAIRHLRPAPNVILAWTISPEPVIRRYEPLTPGLSARLASVRAAADDGWTVRLCFDPVLPVDGWEEQYSRCVNETFAAVPPECVLDVSVGTFRIPRDYLKTMRKQRPESALLHYPFEIKNGVFGYPDELARRLVRHVYDAVRTHVPEQRIFV